MELAVVWIKTFWWSPLWCIKPKQWAEDHRPPLNRNCFSRCLSPLAFSPAILNILEFVSRGLDISSSCLPTGVVWPLYVRATSMGLGREESSEATIGGNIEQLSVWGTHHHRHHLHHQLRPGPGQHSWAQNAGWRDAASSLAQSCELSRQSEARVWFQS